MWDFPPEIVTSILVRLPVKSLLRARCVSKPWRSLIDGQDFTKLHLRHSAETNTNRTLIVQCRDFLQVDLDSLERLDFGNMVFRNPICLIGSCNGLVLLLSLSAEMFLWNPNTRKINELPTPLKAGESRIYNIQIVQHGLGYDSKHDDYKVVRVVKADDGSHSSETTIYSLKANSWKKAAGDFPCGFGRCRISRGVYLNDALHYVVRSYNGEAIIMAFDLTKEGYSEVPKPGAVSVGYSLYSVGVIGGCLAVVVVYEKWGYWEVWVMKEYGAKGSWWKLTSGFGQGNLSPLAYSASGDELLFIHQERRLYWYHLGNRKTKTIARVQGSSGFVDDVNVVVFHAPFDAWVCVASLVSPFSPYPEE